MGEEKALKQQELEAAMMDAAELAKLAKEQIEIATNKSPLALQQAIQDAANAGVDAEVVKDAMAKLAEVHDQYANHAAEILENAEGHELLQAQHEREVLQEKFEHFGMEFERMWRQLPTSGLDAL